MNVGAVNCPGLITLTGVMRAGRAVEEAFGGGGGPAGIIGVARNVRCNFW
jgi:hypothetical protein